MFAILLTRTVTMKSRIERWSHDSDRVKTPKETPMQRHPHLAPMQVCEQKTPVYTVFRYTAKLTTASEIAANKQRLSVTLNTTSPPGTRARTANVGSQIHRQMLCHLTNTVCI